MILTRSINTYLRVLSFVLSDDPFFGLLTVAVLCLYCIYHILDAL